MISRRGLIAGGVSAAGLASAAQLRPDANATRKPNVIVILSDDLGVYDLGCLGAKDLKTPNIDSLGASGARFTNWYSNAPVCAPARSALMTGRYPARCGVPKNGLALPPTEKTIATLLKPAGYATAAIGKWHLGSTPDTVPNAHGFDYFYGFHEGCVDYYSHRYYWGAPGAVNFHDLWRDRTEVFDDGRYLTERITEEAVQFIDSRRSQPFFLYCAYNAVHYPMHAPKKYIERFPNLAPERQTYAAMLSAADDGVGEILRTLEKNGIRDNTLIFFLGDNGATTESRAGLNRKPATAGSNGPFRGFKFSLFDGGMHVPGIMNWPGVIPTGQRIGEIAMTADILPTVCRATGAAMPADRTIDGHDILGLATSKTKSPHDAIYWAEGPQLAVRQGKWKLVINGVAHDRTPEGGKPLQGEDAMFLSDVAEDPGESRNLRRQNPELLDELTTKIHRWRDTVSQK